MYYKNNGVIYLTSRRGSWIPHGANRPPSSFFDSVRDTYDNSDRLAEDLTAALTSNSDLTDTTFLVGKLTSQPLSV